MKVLSEEELRKMALEYNAQDLNWHFHILMPGCRYNEVSDKFAFVLEGPDGQFVNYNDAPHSALGKELAPLAHKTDLFGDNKPKIDHELSESAENIIAKAKELSAENTLWHHHVTSFDKKCVFHEGENEYNLVFENSKDSDLCVANFDHEPIEVLKIIEPLFYAQSR